MTVDKYVENLFEDREKLFAFKKLNKIYLKHIAEFIGVSIPSISQFDCNKINLGKRNLEQYKQFIIQYIQNNVDSKLN